MPGSPLTPDCSSISDNQLIDAIVATWPSTNGVSVIPYGFSHQPYRGNILFSLLNAMFGVKIVKPVSEINTAFTTTIQASLQRWENLSDGSLKFKFLSRATSTSKGIFFLLAQNLKNLDSGAITQKRIDNNGDLFQAFVLLPDDARFWVAPSIEDGWWIESTSSHEIGHALGFRHLHEYPDMLTGLNNITRGVFCSVMPYWEKITSDISQCQPDCDPPHALYPASLDKRLVELGYIEREISNISLDRYGSYFTNISSVLYISLSSSALRQSIFTFLSQLAIHRNEPLVSKRIANMVADVGFMAFFAYLELSPWAIALYAMSSTARNLPDRVIKKLPAPVQIFLNDNHDMYVLNLWYAYLQGQKLLPLLSAFCASYLGSDRGTVLGRLGGNIASICNWIPQKIAAGFFSTEENLTDAELDAMIPDVEAPQEPRSPAQNPHRFFNQGITPARESFCTRLLHRIGFA